MSVVNSNPDAKKYTYAVYVLQALSFVFLVTAVVGIIINYIKDEDVKGTWLESHFEWQKNTFEKKLREGKEGKMYVYRIRPEAFDNSSIGVSIETNDILNALKLDFCQQLKGARLTTFRECKECGRWFVNVSKRGKIFCSNLCASRFGARRRRSDQKKQ